MLKKRDVILVLAGAQLFHTVSHIIIYYSGTLPIQFFFINWTAQMNVWAIAINAIITAALFWWASRLD